MTSGSKLLRIVAGLLGKAWNLPNTLLGLTYGVIGYVAGLVARTNPRVTFGNNAVQFHNNPLMLTAMALGNVIIYGPSRSPEMANVPFCNSPPGHTVGREEFRHTQQGQILGPLYLPVHLTAGIISLFRLPHPQLRCRMDAWHRNNFMETGPMQDRVF
ncbi:MAG TPA: hypothetical protein VMK82_09110 [Steroidobacteraceae bacterium]|nr:hypothetical protein [Steroidobacteraceae bacterium]